MENLLRTYTDQELNDLFEKTRFPEISKQYFIEKYNEKYAEHRKYDIDEEEFQRGKEALLEYLREACCWKVDTLRERAWEATLEELKIEVYIHQREVGHGHEWSKLFCDKMVEFGLKENDVKTYYHTYQAFKELRKEEECIIDSHGCVLKRKKDTLSDREFVLAVKILAKDEGEIVERFIGYWLASLYEGTIEELFQEALDFRKFYNEIIAQEQPEEEAWEYALDLWNEDGDSAFSIAYRDAMKHRVEHQTAWRFAKFCSETDINEQWPFIKERDLTDFPEIWQREFIANLMIKDAGKGWHNYINEIRKSIGLNQI